MTAPHEINPGCYSTPSPMLVAGCRADTTPCAHQLVEPDTLCAACRAAQLAKRDNNLRMASWPR